MSNRGNQDYFKVKGTQTHDDDITRMAHDHFARQQAEERRRPHHPTGPQAMPLNLHKPPSFKVAPPEEKPSPVEMSGEGQTEAKSGEVGLRMPSLLEAVKYAAGAGLKIASWAAGATLDAGKRAVEKRLESVREYAEGIERRTVGRVLDKFRGKPSEG